MTKLILKSNNNMFILTDVDLSGKNLTFAGWGRTESGTFSDALRHVILGILPRRKCSQALAFFNGRHYPKSLIHSVLCAHDDSAIPCGVINDSIP